MTLTELVKPLVESVPFAVSVNVPRTERFVYTDNFVVPDVVTEAGENEAVAPDGNRERLNVTVPVYA